MIQEIKRLSEENHGIRKWKKWGPYLSDRQWGTVREDYSKNGDAWAYISHDLARSKAYRWGEEGIGGISDDKQLLCFSWAFWNKKDPLLKERYFGVTGPEGNHGEDVKEYYYYLDNIPTHSYMKMLYKYPLQAFPYEMIVTENQKLGREDPEFELIDTGIFDENDYVDMVIEYAKQAEDDILIQLSIHNRSSKPAKLDVVPTLWFRNTWSWNEESIRPRLFSVRRQEIEVEHEHLPKMSLYCEGNPELLFCENESNPDKIGGMVPLAPSYKDGINDAILFGDREKVNGEFTGTRAAARYKVRIPAEDSTTIRLRLCPSGNPTPFAGFSYNLEQKIKEADEFYEELQRDISDPDARRIQRQAYAGMLWNKQFYYYDVAEWSSKDPYGNPFQRHTGRNKDWMHLKNADIVSMPDKWEYPWYAAWDLAFHCIPLARLDAAFAKHQLLLLTEGWYLHPNGQLPAYEWNFGDVNPPVHAWAAWRVYEMDKKQHDGKGDAEFLEQIFHKLLLNFGWWINREDREDRNIFQGGFLGLDNIGVFDRSAELPTGGYIEQADGTSWMAMYCLNLLRISLELARNNQVYQRMAGKFFEHFLYIAGAMTQIGGNQEFNLWDDEDEFFYDGLCLPDGHKVRLKIRSLVGLIPLFAVEVLEEELLEEMPLFNNLMEKFLEGRPDLGDLVSPWKDVNHTDRHLLSMLPGNRLRKILRRMLDPEEFLSDYGIRGLSRYHKDHPYTYQHGDHTFEVKYLPAESDSGFFGGNSNWRGPVWFPVNFLLIESLYKFYDYYGDYYKIEYPTGSKQKCTLKEVAVDLSNRLIHLFLRNQKGMRPVFGNNKKFQQDPHFQDLLLFYEYFHGDNGRGVGAAHQTGWTGLVATLLEQVSRVHDPEKSDKVI